MKTARPTTIRRRIISERPVTDPPWAILRAPRKRFALECGHDRVLPAHAQIPADRKLACARCGFGQGG